MGRKEDKQKEQNRLKAQELVLKAMQFGEKGGDLETELQMLDEAIKINPSYHNAYTLKAIALYLEADEESDGYAKMLADANAAIDKAFAMKPDSPYVYYNHWKMKHPGASQDALAPAMAQVLQLQPETLLDHIAHALAHKTCKRMDAAIEKYKSIVGMKEYSKSWVAWSDLAQLYSDIDNYLEAAKAYKIVVGIDKTDTKSWSGWGYALAELGKHKEAEAKYKVATKLDPNDSGISLNLANVLDDQGKYKEAIAVHKQQLALSKTDEDTAIAYHGIAMSRVKLADKDFVKKPALHKKALEDALVESAKAVKLDAKPLYLCGEAEILVKLGRGQEALGFIYKAAELYKVAEDDGSLPKSLGVLEYMKSILVEQKGQLETTLHVDTPGAIARLMEQFGIDHPELSDSSPADTSGDSDQSGTLVTGAGHYDSHAVSVFG